MLPLINRTRAALPRRIRSRAVASVAAIAVSGAALVTIAAPAQALPRSCDNIAQSIMFFELAIDSDTGPYARYLAQDTRMWNYEVRLYYASDC